MIQVAKQQTVSDQLYYAGIDLFEARSTEDAPGMTIKAAHRLLQQTGVRVRLLPGDPFTALGRSANQLGPQDLVVISVQRDIDSLAKAWFFLPRVLAPTSQVLLQDFRRKDDLMGFRHVHTDEIERLAYAAQTRRAA